mgnify:CR=1 FL=1
MSHSRQLEQVTKLIGPQAAIRLVRKKGGQYWSPPHVCSLSDFHWLVMLIGREKSEAFCEEFRGVEIKLPIEVNTLVQLRNESILRDYNAGVNVSQLAENYELDRKMIQKILDTFDARGKVTVKSQQIELGV